MRILFTGVPEIALPTLALLAKRQEICAVLTTPDRRSGRGQRIRSSPVKQLAVSLSIPVLQPERLDAEARQQIAAYAPDLLVCVAYGRLFGPKFLALFPQGAINLHPSLLPRYRGPSPIAAAILGGDRETGVTVQWISREMDAGDVLAQEVIPLHGDETTPSLGATCAQLGADLLMKTIVAIESGSAQARPQDNRQATVCTLILKEDAKINWQHSAQYIERMARAYMPWPGIYTMSDNRRLKLFDIAVASDDGGAGGGAGIVASDDGLPANYVSGQVGVDMQAGILIQTGDGIVVVRRLQWQNRPVYDWQTFLHGNQNIIGSILA